MIVRKSCLSNILAVVRDRHRWKLSGLKLLTKVGGCCPGSVEKRRTLYLSPTPLALTQVVVNTIKQTNEAIKGKISRVFRFPGAQFRNTPALLQVGSGAGRMEQ